MSTTFGPDRYKDGSLVEHWVGHGEDGKPTSTPICRLGHRYGDAVEPWPSCDALCDPREQGNRGARSGGMNGTMTLGGRTIEWSVDALGILKWTGAGIFSFRLPHDRLDTAQIEAALIGWHAGEVAGRHTGRAMLQQEFRNLMGLAQQ